MTKLDRKSPRELTHPPEKPEEAPRGEDARGPKRRGDENAPGPVKKPRTSSAQVRAADNYRTSGPLQERQPRLPVELYAQVFRHVSRPSPPSRLLGDFAALRHVNRSFYKEIDFTRPQIRDGATSNAARSWLLRDDVELPHALLAGLKVCASLQFYQARHPQMAATHFADKVATLLRAAPNVQRLSLGNNALTDAGLARLPLHLCEKLVQLDLSFNALQGDEAQLAGWQSPKSLRELDLSVNRLRAAGVHRIVPDAADKLEELNLDGNFLGTRGQVALDLGQFVGLLRLTMNNTALQGAAYGLDFGALTQLEELSLSGNDIPPPVDGPLQFGPCVRMTRLELSDNNLGDAGVAALPLHNLVELLFLGLNNNGFGARGAAQLPLAAARKLLVLHVAENPLGPQGAAALPLRHVTQLRELGLASTALEDAGIARLALAAVPNLRVLDLEDTGLTGHGVAALPLAGCRAIEDLDLSSNDLEEGGLDGLPVQFLAHLKLLQCNGCAMDDATVLRIPANRLGALEQLDARDNDIGSEGATYLIELANRALRVVDLRGNEVGFRAAFPAGGGGSAGRQILL